MGPCPEEGRGSYRYLAGIQREPIHSNDDQAYLELEWSYCISCKSFFLRESPACNTPVESNFNAIHLSSLTFVSQFCLVDILRRLLRLSAIMIGKEGLMVEVYQRLISVHTLVISKTIGI